LSREPFAAFAFGLKFPRGPVTFLGGLTELLCARFSLLLQLSESQKRPAVGTATHQAGTLDIDTSAVYT
jgi:hypothetical protein